LKQEQERKGSESSDKAKGETSRSYLENKGEYSFREKYT